MKGEITIFVSSVQKELADCRRAVKTFIENDPLLRRFFRVFLFEDLPARDRRADAVYLAEVDGCAIYVGLFGNDYGFEDTDGLSPTEQEFDRATAQCKPRFIFVKGESDKQRHPKMQTLIHKAGSQLIRRRFNSIADLNAAIYASLVDYLETCGIVQTRLFEERPCADATLNDLNVQAVRDFVSSARLERQFLCRQRRPYPISLRICTCSIRGSPPTLHCSFLAVIPSVSCLALRYGACTFMARRFSVRCLSTVSSRAPSSDKWIWQSILLCQSSIAVSGPVPKAIRRLSEMKSPMM